MFAICVLHQILLKMSMHGLFCRKYAYPCTSTVEVLQIRGLCMCVWKIVIVYTCFRQVSHGGLSLPSFSLSQNYIC
jgi:hypothetical protein